MRIVSDRSFHAKSVRFSLLPVNDGVRPAGYLPPPVQRGTPAHPAQHNNRGQLQAVAQRLRPMDRILCVVREWTDDARRGADGTAHKMHWTKPLGHGGSPLEDWKASWRGWSVGLADRTLPESPRRVARATSSPSFPPFRTPSDRDPLRSHSLGTHGERADGGHLGVPADERAWTRLLRVGGQSLPPARAACGAAGWLSPPNGPGGTGDSAQCRCPSDDALPSRRIPEAARGAQAVPTGDGM